MSLPSVTGASHVHADKGELGRRDGNKAPACYCLLGLWVNVGPLIIGPCWSDAAAALFTTHTHPRDQTDNWKFGFLHLAGIIIQLEPQIEGFMLF